MLYKNKMGKKSKKNNSLIKHIATLILGCCIVIPRVIYSTSVSEVTATTVILEFLMELAICIAVLFINKNELKDIIKSKTNASRPLIIFGIAFGVDIVFNIILGILSTSLNFSTDFYDPASAVSVTFHEIFPIPVIITQCILAPITEELAFRRATREIFKNNILYVAISSLLFGFIHIGFAISAGILFYMIYGLTLNIIYIKTKDIKSNMIAHSMNNIIATLSGLMA